MVSGDDNVDPGHQLLGAEGLHNVIVDTQLKSEKLVVFLAPCAQHDGGNVLDLLYFLAGGEAVQLRHHDVHDDQVIVVELAKPQRHHAVLSLVHLISLEFRVFSDDVADLGFVINYEQFIHLFCPPLEKYTY